MVILLHPLMKKGKLGKQQIPYWLINYNTVIIKHRKNFTYWFNTGLHLKWIWMQLKWESGAFLDMGKKFRSSPRCCKLQQLLILHIPLCRQLSGREGCRKWSKPEDLPVLMTDNSFREKSSIHDSTTIFLSLYNGIFRGMVYTVPITGRRMSVRCSSAIRKAVFLDQPFSRVYRFGAG